MTGALQFVELLEEGVPRPQLAGYVTRGSHNTFELKTRAQGSSPTSKFLFMFPVRHRSGPAFAGASRFPPLNGIGAAASL